MFDIIIWKVISYH